MAWYMTKPTRKQAVKYTGPEVIDHTQLSNALNVVHQWGELGVRFDLDCKPYVVTTQGHNVPLRPGDYIVTEPNGNGHYPCDPVVFENGHTLCDEAESPIGCTGDLFAEAAE